MKELMNDLRRWRRKGTRVALGRVVDVEGSAPRQAGAAMAVTEDGTVAGSVSGGCVEGAVVATALEVIESGERRLVTYGYSDDEAFAVGLTCGGIIHIFVEPVDDAAYVDALDRALRDRQPAVLATAVAGPDAGAKVLIVQGGDTTSTGWLDPGLAAVVQRDAGGSLASGLSSTRAYGDEHLVFYEAFVPPPRLVIFGAVDFTSALVRVAKVLGFDVTVCDARAPFATKARFPLADEVVVDWPDRLLAGIGADLGPRDAVCVLTHDAKFDVPAVVGALATDVGYLGALGSRRTTEDRAARLRAAGVTDEELSRLRAPIGIDIGARNPEETAVAICAEIVAVATGRAVPSLRDSRGPIHVTTTASRAPMDGSAPPSLRPRAASPVSPVAS